MMKREREREKKRERESSRQAARKKKQGASEGNSHQTRGDAIHRPQEERERETVARTRQDKRNEGERERGKKERRKNKIKSIFADSGQEGRGRFTRDSSFNNKVFGDEKKRRRRRREKKKERLALTDLSLQVGLIADAINSTHTLSHNKRLVNR